MKNDKQEPLLSWTYHKDGTSDPPATSRPETSQELKEPPKFDYDKLIAESTGLYSMWWILWKRIHPEWALYPEEPKEAKPTFRSLVPTFSEYRNSPVKR